MLNWKYQPENRFGIWFFTIREQPRAINRHFYRNPSLQSRIFDALEDGFEAGVDLALRETNLPLRTFPEKCPYKFEEIIADNFIAVAKAIRTQELKHGRSRYAKNQIG